LRSPVSERKRYPSDLSNERWALIEPVITAWKARHRSVRGHQGGYEMREIVNAILYQVRTGCQWEYLPHDLPPRSAAYYYFARWRDDGTDQAIHDLLRWHAREQKGRRADPSLVVLDTQSVHAAASVPAGTSGKDAGKIVNAASVDGDIWSNPTSTSRTVAKVAPSDPTGGLICTDGLTNLEVCSVKFESINQDVTYDINGVSTTVTGTVYACQTAGKAAFSGGDSGGPVETTLGSTSATARGEILANTDSAICGWYLPERTIESDWDASTVLG
jgi:transposase